MALSSFVFLDWVSLIFLLMIVVGFRSDKLDGQSNTVITWSANYLVVLLALWAVAKFC